MSRSRKEFLKISAAGAIGAGMAAGPAAGEETRPRSTVAGWSARIPRAAASSRPSGASTVSSARWPPAVSRTVRRSSASS